jgi:hypothetical protein
MRRYLTLLMISLEEPRDLPRFVIMSKYLLLTTILSLVVHIPIVNALLPGPGHTAAYLQGYRNYLKPDTCYNYNGTLWNNCEAGRKAAVDDAVQYAVGFTHGKINRSTFRDRGSFNTDNVNEACKDYNGRGFNNCALGYGAGFAIPVNNSKQQIAMTTAYKEGFREGVINETVSCKNYNYRDPQGMCSQGYDDGYLTLPWSYKEYYKFGYYWGKLGAEGKASGDRAGDCSFTPYDSKKSEVCETGWNAAWKKYTNKPLS